MKKLLSILVICSLMTVMFGVGATTVSASSTDEYILVNYDSGKALTTNCDNIQQNDIVLNNCQIWHIVERGTTCDNRKYYTIENYASGKVMEVENSSTARYANVQQECYTGCDNQLWFIDYCETKDFAAYYHIENKNSGKLLSVAAPYGAEGSNVQQYENCNYRDQLWAILSLEDH